MQLNIKFNEILYISPPVTLATKFCHARTDRWTLGIFRKTSKHVQIIPLRNFNKKKEIDFFSMKTILSSIHVEESKNIEVFIQKKNE